MQKENTFRLFWSRNNYLLVIAAWLITLSFIIENYWSGNATVKTVQKKIEDQIQHQEKDFEGLISDTSFIQALEKNRYELHFLEYLAGKNYFLFHYHINGIGDKKLTFWNNNSVMPSVALLDSPGNAGFIQLPNGFYVWRKAQMSNELSLALIPVKWNYIVTNTYLENSFTAGRDVGNDYELTLTPTNSPVKSLQGKLLFYIFKKNGSFIHQYNLPAVWLRILATLLLLFLIHLYASHLAINQRFWRSVLFLSGTIMILRIASYYFPIPLNFRQFELFDPAIYGSNLILRSLGDLLINTVLFTWLVLFLRQHTQKKSLVSRFKNKAIKMGILVLVALTMIAATFICGNIIRSLVADSQISFDVINFFTLTTYSVTGFIVLCCLAIGYFLLCQILLNWVKSLYPSGMSIFFLTITVAGMVYLTLRLIFSTAAFEIALLIWLIFYLFLLNNRILRLKPGDITTSQLVFWVFFFSLSITSVIVTENKNKERLNRQHVSETLATKSDPTSETLMNTMLTDFRNEFLATHFNRFRSEPDNLSFRDSLVNSNFSPYSDKYETKIYVFDATEHPLFKHDLIGFNELNTVLHTQAKRTGIPNLYYYDVDYNHFNYISRKDITDASDSLLGYIFIIANPKNNRPETLSPELFSKGQDNSIENSTVYAYAVYQNLLLVNSHNDYSFPTRLSVQQVPKGEFSTFSRNGYNELWYRAGLQKVVVIVKKDNLLLETMTLFSYLFCAFLLVTFIFWTIHVLIRSRFRLQRLKDFWQPSIRSQIHGTIIFISILSFLVIGVATILFFISRYQNNNREKLSLAIHIMEKEVRNSLADLSVFDDVLTLYDKGYRDKLEKLINKIAEIHGADINLFDLEGNLQVSSLPLPYQKGIVSEKMDPIAFYHLNNLKQVQFFEEEKIGKLSYVSNYVPVIDESGREYAYLNIPYFTSESRLKDEIANFLVTIINLNAFIFLIAGIVALFITNRITRSFTLISNKMKAVNLGRLNEAINWDRNDEIGDLVNEYNKMVGKLDESAAALAKSEREGAWREMARQVAHEIKNPLTPMKLSLQYLQKAIKTNSGNVKELTASVAQTLVEQIDHLNKIAGEFSQFANIGNPNKEKFEFHELLRSLLQLYVHEENLELIWKPVAGDVFLYADRTHINRLFTNLIQNALQSVENGKKSFIEIEENLGDQNIQLYVKDNGIGIPENVRYKIFTPNFTTKTSGTGLGLAMCKSIVEQTGGKIWFETEIGKGSIFYVELPFIKGFYGPLTDI